MPCYLVTCLHSVSELSGLLSLSLHLKQHYKHNEAAAAREVSELTMYLYGISMHICTLTLCSILLGDLAVLIWSAGDRV
jgi:hypothetical protein